METLSTPVKEGKLINDKVTIPASPFMKCLGFGTGISVYELNRSPRCSQVRSPWAIKKITKPIAGDELGKRLLNEAVILKKLNHPNVVGFRTLTKDTRGTICLAMEACTKSLGDMIESRNENGLLAFPAVNIGIVAADIAKALSYLHNVALVLHCDVKSYNILVQNNFEICKLCDFGISLPLRSDGTVDPYLLSNCPSLGTGPWQAPEVVISEIATSKSDVYSYGLVIWEMIALTVPPFNGGEEPENSDVSILDKSQFENSSDPNSSTLKAMDESECNESLDFYSNTKFKCIDWRPELPSQEFSEDYNNILELFYCCTEKEAAFRPSADLLVKVTCEIMKKLSNK